MDNKEKRRIRLPPEFEPLLEDLRLLKTDGDNPNVMGKRLRESVWRSLTKFGWIKPILVDKNGLMGDGEQRVIVCIEHEEYEGPVLRLDVDDVDRRLLRQVANKLHGTHDALRDALEYRRISAAGSQQELIKLIQLSERDLRAALEGPLGEPEEYQLPPLEAVITDIELGDLYELGPHRILCGDTTKQQTLKLLMGDAKAHMMLTDPPYNVDYAEKTAFMLKIRKGYTRAPIEGDKITDLYAFLCDFLDTVKHHFTPYNATYITFAEKNLRFLLNALDYCGYYHSQTLVWNKNAPVLGRSDYRYKHEAIVYCWWGKHKFYGKRERTVWDIPKPSQSKLHPTMKPIELCTRAITNSTMPKEIVLDPFVGSGSTIIAAEKTDRVCYAIDIEPRYVQIAIDRWEAYTGQEAHKI